LIVSRPPQFPVEDKLRIVLSVLSGEMSIVEAARRNKTSEQSIGRWKQQFIEGGRAGLAEGGRLVDNPRERALLEQIEELTSALGEAHVELRVWKKSAEYRLAPSRTSR
jgi:transposase